MNYSRPHIVELRLLPIHDAERAYTVKHETCKAIFETYDGEVRIAYVAREERGDFKALMNRLTEELNNPVFRFVEIEGLRESEFKELVERHEPDDARSITEAVNGFDRETIHEYENSNGEIEPVETLVGRWGT